jgi:hypothetical protein
VNRRQEGSFSMLLPQLMILTLILGVVVLTCLLLF